MKLSPRRAQDGPFNDVEAILGVCVTRELLARDAADLLRKRCDEAPTGSCAELVRMETAAEVWHAVALMLADLLKQKGGRL